MKKSYLDLIATLYSEPDLRSCRNITLQVCDDCCLKCSYCYQIHKSHNYMTKETAKAIIDLLFRMYDEDKPDAFINHTTHGIILDFIGGEPLMNVEIMEFATEYFIDQCLQKNHEWLYNFRTSFATNGILYFEPKVQAYLQKFHNFISMTVSIDGPKEIHDICRLDRDGNGSFERASTAAHHYWEHYGKDVGGRDETKVTIAPDNLSQLNKIVDYFLNEGVTVINANPVYEVEWTVEQAKIYYNELKKLANKLLLNLEIKCSIFDSHQNVPLPISDNTNWCGGDGHMLAFDPHGNAYPCLRYMESSLGGEVEPLIIGDTNGIYNTPESQEIRCKLCALTRSSQSTEECAHCPIASGCSWCFPAGTLIKTPHGFKNIEDLQEGDEVCDMTGVAQKIKHIYQHNANNLYYIKAAGVPDLLTTKNHPFYTKKVIKRNNNIPTFSEPEWVKAEDIQIGDKIGLFVPKLGNIEMDEKLAYIVGRYIGDGWKSPSYRKLHPFKYYLCSSYDEEEELTSKLDEAKVSYKKSYNKTVVEYHIHLKNKVLCELFDKCGRYAADKQIPLEVYSWKEQSVKSLLQGYFDADGSNSELEMRYITISKILVYQIAELVRAVYHYNVSITVRKPPNSIKIQNRQVNQSISYEGRFKWSPKKMFYTFDAAENIMWVSVSHSTKEVPAQETVYNFEVENNPTYIANGCIVHNCSAWNYQQFKKIGKRSTNICWMHRAAALANVYYWNLKYRLEENEKRFPIYLEQKYALQIIPSEEYDLLLSLSQWGE